MSNSHAAVPSDTISRQDYLVELISENYRKEAPFICDDDLRGHISQDLQTPNRGISFDPKKFFTWPIINGLFLSNCWVTCHYFISQPNLMMSKTQISQIPKYSIFHTIVVECRIIH